MILAWGNECKIGGNACFPARMSGFGCGKASHFLKSLFQPSMVCQFVAVLIPIAFNSQHAWSQQHRQVVPFIFSRAIWYAWHNSNLFWCKTIFSFSEHTSSGSLPSTRHRHPPLVSCPFWGRSIRRFKASRQSRSEGRGWKSLFASACSQNEASSIFWRFGIEDALLCSVCCCVTMITNKYINLILFYFLISDHIPGAPSLELCAIKYKLSCE